MKKTIMFIIMLAVCLLVAPSVYAEEAVEYPEVENATKSDSLIEGAAPTVTGSKTNTVTVTVDSGTFKILGTGAETGVQSRPDGYTWVGLHFKMPTGITQEEEIKINGTHDTTYKSSEFDEYFGFKVDELKAAVEENKKSLTQTYTLTWKDSKSQDQTQTINIVINLEDIVVIDQNSEEETWNEDIYHKENGDVKLTITAVYFGEVGDNYTDALYLPKNSKMPTEASLRKALVKAIGSKYEIVGFYSDEAMKNKFDFSKKLTEDTTLYIKIVDAKEEANPATGDNLLTYVSLSVIALTGALGTGLYLKKVNE